MGGRAKQDQLNAKLEALDVCTLELLVTLGLENTALRPKDWAARAAQRGVRGPQGEVLSMKRFNQLVDALRKNNLVDRDASVRDRAPSEVAIAAMARLHAGARLLPLTEPERERERSRELLAQQSGRFHMQPQELATSLRVAVFSLDAKILRMCTDAAATMLWHGDLGRWLVDAVGTAPSAAALQHFAPAAREAYLRTMITTASAELLVVPEHMIVAAIELGDKPLKLEVGRLLILRGETERALALKSLPAFGAEGLALLAAFWAGDYAEAARIGAETTASMKSRKHKLLPGLEGVCHVLAAIASSEHDPHALAAVESLIQISSKRLTSYDDDSHLTLAAIHASLLGTRQKPQARSHAAAWRSKPWTSNWVAALHDVWIGVRPSEPPDGLERALARLRELASNAAAHGFAPVARELDAVLTALAGDDETVEDSPPTLATSFRAAAPWETALIGLDAIVAATVKPSLASGPQRQLLWELSVHAGYPSLAPRVRASERARKGQPVPLSRLLSGDEDYLDEHDQRVLGAAEPMSDTYNRWRHGGGPLVLGPRALMALVGHPRVIDERGTPLTLVAGQPRLHTKRSRKGVRVSIEPHQLVDRDVHCRRDGDRAEIFVRTAELERVADILGDAGIEVPKAGLDRLGRTLARLCVAAGVEVEGDLTPETEQVAADPRPTLLLGWDGEVLSGRVCVAPLGLAGPHLRAGVGNSSITAELREHGSLRLLRCERELSEERRRYEELERACPTMSSYAGGTAEWRVPKLADALDVMLELGRLGDAIVIAWPQGRTLQPPTERDLKHLKLEVSSQRDWLGVDVQLELDEGEVLSFRQLLDARAGDRFVRLDEGRFVALSEQLRRRLDALEPLAERKRDGLRASPVMLPLLDELTADLEGASFDDEALARLQRLRKLASAQPRRPRGFAAELRDYQKDGYAWMWRLAEAGLGGCLADDMGLGKTVQALALLSQRASKGPALVVCPTSVVINWTSEASRFAPNLRTTILAESGDRAAVLAQLGRRDLLVCSYGVLAIEIEALAKVEFATAIFDEAHALKNSETARAGAARDIHAQMRLGLTGTPVENRVDELWSLFAVLTPGLLGSKTDFEERFAKPIARGDRERTTQLRSLLRPFLLRRTKSQVLDELPERTEITLRIQPRADERAFYEALRRRAVEALKKDPRKKRFRILAEITRLRQAAVDPRLIDEHAAPAGAKLDAIVEQLLALREEGHRALVFTQFLGSMALLRERFDAAELEYLELDGSTSASERARRVDAFQSGEADVFMLSLRAGGVGMNLTGADYVLHVDPWWNPAVEDQATDRAHRIGQTRPVTVYRFVTEGSIEEKILALHERKRELADDILADLEGTQALDLDALMSLL
ncbi:MAG TPA: DEAD/DEAH box helicase [Enhygromyxa sp.]|nr:DEAD/DEAH box helicase [Enhygromyxa sp.]